MNITVVPPANNLFDIKDAPINTLLQHETVLDCLLIKCLDDSALTFITEDKHFPFKGLSDLKSCWGRWRVYGGELKLSN